MRSTIHLLNRPLLMSSPARISPSSRMQAPICQTMSPQKPTPASTPSTAITCIPTLDCTSTGELPTTFYGNVVGCAQCRSPSDTTTSPWTGSVAGLLARSLASSTVSWTGNGTRNAPWCLSVPYCNPPRTFAEPRTFAPDSRPEWTCGTQGSSPPTSKTRKPALAVACLARFPLTRIPKRVGSTLRSSTGIYIAQFDT